MNDHYSGFDPLRGCGCMVLIACAAIAILGIYGFINLVWSWLG